MAHTKYGVIAQLKRSLQTWRCKVAHLQDVLIVYGATVTLFKVFEGKLVEINTKKV